MTNTTQGGAAATLARTKRIEIQHFADGGTVRRTTVRDFGKPGSAAAQLAQVPASHAGAKNIEHGGPVRGPGGPTSDSVPLWGSAGEFMLPADTTAAVGKDKLQELVDATHTPTKSAGEKMGRLARADGGPVENQPGAVNRVGNSYSGGDVSGGITVNGQAPGGTVSTIDSFRAAPAPAAPSVLGTTSAVVPVPPKPALPGAAPAASTTPGVPAPVQAPAVAPPPNSMQTGGQTSWNGRPQRPSGAEQILAALGQVGQSTQPAPAPAPRAQSQLASTNSQIFAGGVQGYADGGVIVDPRNPMARLPAVPPSVVVPPQAVAGDVMGRRPTINMGMADVVQPAQLTAPPRGGTVAAQQAMATPPGEVIGRRPPINMGGADVVQPARVAAQPAAAALAAPEAAVGARSVLSRVAGPVGAAIGVGMEGKQVYDVATNPNSTAVDVAAQAAQGVGRLSAAGAGAAGGAAAGSVLGPVGTALGGIVGGGLGYFAADRAIAAGRAATGSDPRSPAEQLATVPPAAAVAPAQPEGGGAAFGFFPQMPKGGTPDVRPMATQAQVRAVDNNAASVAAIAAPPSAPAPAPATAAAPAVAPAAAPASERPNPLGGLADTNAQLASLQASNAAVPLGGATIIDNAASEADRRAQFNEQANLNNAVARTSWSPRRGTQGDDAAVAAALTPLQSRARAAIAARQADAETQKALIAERGSEARAKIDQSQQAQSNDIARQRLGLEAIRVAKDGVPLGYRWKADGSGNLEPIPGGNADPNTAKGKNTLTEGQSKALLFGSRMQASNKILGDLEASGKVFSTPGANTPYVGGMVNLVNTEKGQQLDQAKRDFLNATLRRESGAVISPDEFSNGDKQYFPQPGDSPKVIAQKRQNREVAIRGIQAEVPNAEQRTAAVVGDAGNAAAPQRTVARTGMLNGRRVLQYSDGSIEYGN